MFETFTTEPIAIRGDRVALIRVRLARDGFDTTMLGVYETDERGLLSRGTSFDEEDLDLAFEELDERHILGEGAEHEYLIRRLQDGGRARRSGDPRQVRALLSPHFTVVDHRTLGYGTFDIEGLETYRAARDVQVSDDVVIHRSREIFGDVYIGWYEAEGTTPDGSRYSWPAWVVWQLAGGLWSRAEIFDLSDEPAARARFEELAAETRTPHIDNAAVRLNQRGVWLGTFDETFDRTESMADDLVIEDRRSGVSIGRLHGIAAAVENIEAQDELFGPTTFEPVAVRGEHLMLARTRWCPNPASSSSPSDSSRRMKRASPAR